MSNPTGNHRTNSPQPVLYHPVQSGGLLQGLPVPDPSTFIPVPVPPNLSLPGPTEQELESRRITAIAQGVRQIESAWPEGAARTPRSTAPNRGFNTRTRGGLFRRSNRGMSDRDIYGPGRGHPSSIPLTRQGSREQQERHRLARRSYTDRALPLLMTLPTHGERGRTAGHGSNSRDRGQIGDNEHEIQATVSFQNTSRDNPDHSGTPYTYQTSESTMVNTGSGRGYESGRTRNPNGGNFRDHRALPFLVNNDWKDKDGISVKFSEAPMSFGIFEAYNVFKEYGEIETLDLYETKSGVLDGSGRVRFSGKVNTAFWQKTPFRYTLQGDGWGKEGSLTLRLDEPRRRCGIPSLVDKGKVYPPKYVFKVKTLQFGLMYEQNAMMPMFTTTENDSVTLEVDLHHRALDVVFKIGLARNQSNPPTEPAATGDETGSLGDTESAAEKVEHYRFQIPFSHLGRLLEVKEPSSTTGRVFVITAQSVPRFWRKFKDPLKTIALGTKHWDIRSCWFRQTGISFENRTRASLPVSLKQSDQIINIGRWTTYCLDFDAKEAMTSSFDEMIAALKDFNINTDIVDGFQLLEEKNAPIWEYIDIKGGQNSNTFLNELHEASSPLLPYPVRYQLEVCMSQNCLSEYNITTQFIDRLASLPVSQAVSLLEHVAEKGARIFQPMTVFDLRGIPKGTAGLKLPGHCQLVRKASITPTTVYFATPSVEITNRVVRQYSEHLDRFLRVQFVDEKLQGRINSTDKKTLNEVFTRVKAALDNGITIGGRHFEFLAFGNSQIREHGAYFFSSTEHLSAADIRAWMGEFKSIKIVAKHAARLGQCFSTTRAISGVRVDVRNTEDITNEAGYNFSDGVGKISGFVAHLITTELDLKLPDSDATPSCFQFRLGGCKGVLTVWPDARQREVFIRPSQRKFEATHNILEVIRWSRFATAALNRQLITVLSSLGAPDRYFQEKLALMLKRYEEAMVDPKTAIKLLCKNVDFNESTLKIAAMVREGFMARQEPFVMSLLKLWRAWAIKYLKERAKIMIDEGAFLLGVVDETGILDGYYSSKPDNIETSLPEIFVQVDDPENSGKFMIIEGPCIIARNPSLHPGDVRKVLAVNVPELHHLRNVVVFPQRGDRDLANMLSGGDLDGDDYIVIWDKALTASVTNHPPMEYTPMEAYELDRDVEVNDITKFFVNYMRNDCLGTIANAHLAWADKLDAGVMSEQCFRLASLHSDAVDYVKSGQRAEMPPDLRVKKFPHFMEKEPEKTYQSEKILGFLYDAVSAIDFVPAFELEFDDRILKAYNLDPSILDSAREIKARYDSAMYRIMAQHDIRTEFEVISTFVMHHSCAVKDYKFHEEIGGICHSLKDTFKRIIYDVVGSRDAKMGPYVAAMYTVTQQEMANAKEIHLKRETKIAIEREARENSSDDGDDGDTERTERTEFTVEEATKMPLISFPWLFAKILGRIANREFPYRDLNETPVGPLPRMELGPGRAPQVNGNGTEKATWLSFPSPHA